MEKHHITTQTNLTDILEILILQKKAFSIDPITPKNTWVQMLKNMFFQS